MTIHHELTILELRGNLTLMGCEKSLTAIKDAMKLKAGPVLVDFKHVDFVDSAGLATLVRLHKITQAVGRRLALCSIPLQLKQLLHLTNMDMFFETFDNRENFYESWLSQFPAEAAVPQQESIPIVTINTD
jgi:anti-anti-sigma factor